MYLKNILIISFSFLLFISFNNYCFAASRILSGEISAIDGSLVLLADVNKEQRLISVDLRTCNQEKSIPLPKETRKMIISEYISSYAILGGKSLMVFNIPSGKIINSFDDFIRPVTVINQSDMGEYVVASDGRTVALYQFKKEGLTKLYTKEFSGGVVSLYPDIESNVLYVVERNGKISLWSFSGKLQDNINVNLSIYDLKYDSKTGKFLASAQSGLYYISKDNYNVEKLLNGKVLSFFIEEYSSRLQVMTSTGFTVYDYPAMRAVINLDGANGLIISSSLQNVAAFSGLNFIRLYDLKSNIHTATIAVDSLGMINFYPPEMAYGTNISSSFIAAAANSQEEKQVYDKDRVCAPIAAMVSGVYSPNNINLPAVKIDNVSDPYSIPTPTISQPKEVNAPQISFKNGNIVVPEVKDNTKVAEVGFNEHKSNVVDPKNTSDPKEPKVKDIDELLSTNVPNWVANRKNLPENNAVSSANNEQDAIISAKKNLKNKLVKKALTSIVQDKSLSSITDINVKKRILWQSSAKAVNSLDSKILTVDTWKSPAGQIFIHLISDDATLLQEVKNSLAIELKKYYSNNPENYMAEKVYSLD